MTTGSSRQPDSRPGTYVLILRLDQPRKRVIGKLGEFNLEPGWYAYVGSAFGPGGVKARCRHHRGIAARPHWHIDYLRAECRLVSIWFSHDNRRLEHSWASLLQNSRGARAPIPGFGATDCTCNSHLFLQPREPSFRGFRRRAAQGLEMDTKVYSEPI